MWDLLRWGVWSALYIWVWGLPRWEYREENCWSGESYKRWVIGWELWKVGDFWNSSTEKRREKLLLVGWELWEVGEFNISGVRVGWVLRHEGEHREERRDEIVQRRGDKIKKKKLISSESIGRKKLSKHCCVYYEFAIRNVCSVFKITSAHNLKHRVQTMVFQQQFPNNSILNRMTKHIILPFGH